jgi:putative ABC transport system substrate-binding protein
VARAQQPATAPRIGFLSLAPLSSITARTDAFRQGLRDLGYVEGRNISVEWRSADDHRDRLPALAPELVKLRVAVIVSADNSALNAARNATERVPIVIAQSGDPVAIGFVPSLAHPGGNITGLTTIASELPIKEVQLLKEIVPKLARLAVLSNPDNPTSTTAVKYTRAAAEAIGLNVSISEVRDPSALAPTFSAMTKEGADGLIVLPDPMFLTQRSQIAELAERARLPAIYGIPEHAQAGGLMSYAADRTVLFQRAAIYVDKILRGTQPGDLPIEQPTKFELVINLKTAKALGLTIPKELLLRADEVIQ